MFKDDLGISQISLTFDPYAVLAHRCERLAESVTDPESAERCRRASARYRRPDFYLGQKLTTA